MNLNNENINFVKSAVFLKLIFDDKLPTRYLAAIFTIYNIFRR